MKIVEEDKENPVSQQVWLPELKVLVVRYCNNLKHVLSMSTHKEFPKLAVMMIHEASQLREVFRAKIEGEGEIEEPKQAVLPNLKWVILIKLPNLINVCEGMELERVEYQFVRDCNSNITPTSSNANLMHFRLKYLDFGDPMELGDDCRRNLNGLINELTNFDKEDSRNPKTTIENPTAETTIGSSSSQTGIENLKSEITEAAAPESQQSFRQAELIDQHLSESCSKHQQRALGETENTTKTFQEINVSSDYGIEKIKEQSVEEYSEAKEKVGQMEDLVNEQSPNQPSSKDQQRIEEMEGQNSQDCLQLEETVVENGSKKTDQVVTSDLSEVERAQPRPSTGLVNKASQTEQAYTEIDSKVDPIDLQDLKNERLIQSMEEDCAAYEPMPPFSMIADKHSAKDNLVAKMLGDLEVYLKMHLKDIASSESCSMCLLISLNFLSRLSIGDGVLSLELKSIVDSLQNEFPGILCSFKEASAMVKKFADLEEREKLMKDKLTLQTETGSLLASKISEISKLKDEAQEKKAILETQICRLQVELEFENVKKDKSQFVDKQRKAQQQLLQADYKWSIFCSQFERSLGVRMASTPVFHLHETSNLQDNISVNPTNLQDSENDHNVEEDVIPIRMPTLPVIVTENIDNEENLVWKVLAELEGIMKMPLKDIANLEDNILRLHTALNFLSHLSCEDEALSKVLKDIIDFLYQVFPSIFSSFKEAFAMIKKISELEERGEPIEEELARQKKKVISLGSVYHNMDDAKQKETILKEQITQLQVELESVKETIKDCEATLPSLQEQKNKCVADIKGFEMQFQKKAQQILIHTDYRWRVLCSRFEMNRIAARSIF